MNTTVNLDKINLKSFRADSMILEITGKTFGPKTVQHLILNTVFLLSLSNTTILIHKRVKREFI